MTTWFIPPPILGFNSIRNELDWAQNELEISPNELSKMDPCCSIGRRAYIARARPYASDNILQILYHFEAPDDRFPTQLELSHLDLCSSSYDRLSARRSGLTALRFLHFFMSSPTLHAFSSFLPSNTCLINLKSLNKHIKASNGIKVN